jgi:hypothetical protein
LSPDGVRTTTHSFSERTTDNGYTVSRRTIDSGFLVFHDRRKQRILTVSSNRKINRVWF